MTKKISLQRPGQNSEELIYLIISLCKINKVKPLVASEGDIVNA